MSHYLSSFLIEPVVRQARRFSRQNTDDRPFRPVDVHPPAEQGAEIHQSTPWVLPEAVAPETSWQRLPDQHSPEESERATARYSEEPSDAEVRAWRDVHRPSGISHEESLAAVFSPDSTLPNDQFSSNPVHSVAESLRSTTSSLSDPAHFAMDSDAMEVHGSAQSSIQHHPTDATNPSVQTGDGALPEDDGMTAKRRQIVAIHNTRSSNTEKARLVHSLMNERYSSLQPNLQTPHPPSTLTLASHAKPNPSTSGHTGSTIAPSTFPPASLSVSSETNDLFNLSVEDLKPTYHQKPEVHRTSSGPGNRSSNRLSQESLPEYKALGCPHYKRNIKLQSQRETNSAPPSAVISPTQLTRPVESQNLEEFAREVVTMDEHGDSLEAISDGDYSDVDFWGLESPSARGTRGSPDEPAEDDSSDEYSSQGVANDNDCTVPGDDGDDDDEEDAMEIFGHR
ncbi:MAG: hypothetical protein L6R36_006573 [Xanthoria steineri]|nr:MAG: hypothetical protein L6R36_006573 [Xanthoria steineri]